LYFSILYLKLASCIYLKGRRGRDRMVVEFTSTYTIIYDFVVDGIYMFVCVVCLIVFSATVNNISAIRSWWCFLLVEETGGPGEISP
jgi:hypothetical protein